VRESTHVFEGDEEYMKFLATLESTLQGTHETLQMTQEQLTPIQAPQDEGLSIEVGRLFLGAAEAMRAIKDEFTCYSTETLTTNKKHKTAVPELRCIICGQHRSTKVGNASDSRVQTAAQGKMCLACHDKLRDKVPYFAEIVVKGGAQDQNSLRRRGLQSKGGAPLGPLPLAGVARNYATGKEKND
jgi:hypothetical protein